MGYLQNKAGKSPLGYIIKKFAMAGIRLLKNSWLGWKCMIVSLRPIFVTRASPKRPVGQSQILNLEDCKADVGDLNLSAIFLPFADGQNQRNERQQYIRLPTFSNV